MMTHLDLQLIQHLFGVQVHLLIDVPENNSCTQLAKLKENNLKLINTGSFLRPIMNTVTYLNGHPTS